MIPHSKIQNILNESTDDKTIFGMVVCLCKDDEWQSVSSGNMTVDSPYFIASITKLFTGTIILKLTDKGILSLDDHISSFLSPEIIDKIHIYKGIDYSGALTIRQLMSNTSGLPDYFEQKRPGALSIKEELIRGNDLKLEFIDMIGISKTMCPKFHPGKKGKAFYSDTGFQLLGRIIETVVEMKLSQAYQKYIFEPLHLKHTYLYTDPEDENPVPLYYKKNMLSIPKIMASFGADGGIVSTAE